MKYKIGPEAEPRFTRKVKAYDDLDEAITAADMDGAAAYINKHDSDRTRNHAKIAGGPYYVTTDLERPKLFFVYKTPGEGLLVLNELNFYSSSVVGGNFTEIVIDEEGIHYSEHGLDRDKRKEIAAYGAIVTTG